MVEFENCGRCLGGRIGCTACLKNLADLIFLLWDPSRHFRRETEVFSVRMAIFIWRIMERY